MADKHKVQKLPLRIGLRTILLVVTVLCVVLGVWSTRSVRQRRVVAAIQELGGVVEYASDEANSLQTFLAQRLGPDFTFEIYSVDFSETDIHDGNLELISELPSVVSVYLSSTKVTGDGLESLKRLTKLENLSLDRTEVTNGSLSHIAAVSYTHLTLPTTPYV